MTGIRALEGWLSKCHEVVMVIGGLLSNDSRLRIPENHHGLGELAVYSNG